MYYLQIIICYLFVIYVMFILTSSNREIFEVTIVLFIYLFIYYDTP